MSSPADPNEIDDGRVPVNRHIMLLSLLAAIGGFLFGYDTGVVSGAMILLKTDFNLDSFWQELIVSVTVGAAAIFAFAGGMLTDRFGRKKIIIIGSALFLIGAIILAAAQGKGELVAGRFVIGMGLGLSSMTVPMYIAEASPPHLRGRLVTMNNLFVTMGQFIASLLDGAFSYLPQGWRYMFGVAGIPALIQLIGFFFLPESPRWLIEHGLYESATTVLLKLRGSKLASEKELEEIKESYIKDREDRKEKGGELIILSYLKTPHLRRALIVGCCLQLFQQVTGINTVMYYSATIIEMAGVSDFHSQIWLAAVTAGVNFVCTFIGLYLVERIGRRPLTLLSLFGVMLSLFVLAIGFQVMALTSPHVAFKEGNSSVCSVLQTCDACINQISCGYCFSGNNGSCLSTNAQDSGHSLLGRCSSGTKPGMDWAYNWCPTSYSWIIVLGLMLYLFCFAPGMGPMPWTMNAEIFPQWARSTGIACATATNWIFNLIVSMTFLTLMESITKQGAYYLYTAVALIALIFFYWVLPETKGRPLEEVEELFQYSWFSKEFIRDRRNLRSTGSPQYDDDETPNHRTPLLADEDSDDPMLAGPS